MAFFGYGHDKPSDSFSGTLSGRIYRRLRDEIITGALAPGERLVRRSLAKRFDVSVIPILEALLRLENDGLVEYEEKIGARVVTITAETIHTHRMIREGLEIHMARVFAKNASRAGRDRVTAMAAAIDANHVRLAALGYDELPSAFRVHHDFHDGLRAAFRLHYDFHLAIPVLAGYPGVAAEMRGVWFKRLVFFSNVDMIETPPVGDFLHAPLAEALVSGDPGRAEEAMRTHLDHTRKNYPYALDRFLSIPDEGWRRDLFLVDEEFSPGPFDAM